MAVFAVCVILLPSFESRASEPELPEPYEYKLTFYSGIQGTFENGSDEKVLSELPAGAIVSFSPQSSVVLPENSKYYVKGVRLSGRDNAEAEFSTLTVEVNRDADYVIAYGIKGNMVDYTVHYVDQWGNKLADSDVFYGKVGDKPVIAYKYIERYAPKSFALTKTLSENAAENVFTFEYKEAAVKGEHKIEYVDGGTNVIIVDRGTIVRPGGGAGSGTGAGTGESAAEGQEAEGEGTSPSQGEVPPSQEIVDLDDEDTPLGNIDLEDAGQHAPLALIIGLSVIGLLALIILLIIVLRSRQRSKNAK